VKFYAHTFRGTVFVTNEGEVVYSLLKVVHNKPVEEVVLREELIGGKINNEVRGEAEAVTKVSYIKGNDRSRWRSRIPTYEVVSFGEVYKGVELKLRAYSKTVEKLFYVKPGGEPGSIRVKLSGGKGLEVNERGELEVETELGRVKLTKPVAYQESEGGGGKEFVEVAYVVGGDEYGFRVGEYDRGRELVIDPILASTFLGGTGFFEGAFAIAIDGTGNVYVAGRTYALDFPGIDAGSADSIFSGQETFVAKLNSTLSTIISATYMGGE